MGLGILATIFGVISFRAGITVGLWARPDKANDPLFQALRYDSLREFGIDIATAGLGVSKFARGVPAFRGFVTSIAFRRALARLVGADLKTVGGFIPTDVASFVLGAEKEGLELLGRTSDLVVDSVEFGAEILTAPPRGVLGAAKVANATYQLYVDAVALGGAWQDFVERKAPEGERITRRYLQAAEDVGRPLFQMAKSTADGLRGFAEFMGLSTLFAPIFPITVPRPLGVPFGRPQLGEEQRSFSREPGPLAQLRQKRPKLPRPPDPPVPILPPPLRSVIRVAGARPNVRGILQELKGGPPFRIGPFGGR